ncbi:hypothetical protein EOA79_02490 [Mesorhizobium sp. M1A.F.Ca.IN.020.03.2.1]|uniref:hypothetical protein n=1 Tax=Mesorhizobium sp. M1A.F.Ca.IN.020.03.2.1 TaxID=2496769 RepID=UPI000FD4BD71|nr:hypothetical protein [Mesorhizobium sp. M1A.F.Ca.IN.020.03.2.1]RUV07976.1 hypothetical protein EOA79_02490 [Mesorhizobium sp. M1A.F.Ca.IN.020.03.2.1]
MSEAKHTPGPWGYVPGHEHHGPYVTSDFGSTICDLYTMSNPSSMSVRNGGDSRPLPFLAEMAEPNARLIAAAPDMLAALKALCDADASYWGEEIRIRCPGHGEAIKRMRVAREAIAKAEGR